MFRSDCLFGRETGGCSLAALPRGSYSAEADGDTDVSTSVCGTFARVTHWALARDRCADVGVDVEAGWRGAVAALMLVVTASAPSGV